MNETPQFPHYEPPTKQPPGPPFVARDHSKYLWKAIKTHLPKKRKPSKQDVHIKQKKIPYW